AQGLKGPRSPRQRERIAPAVALRAPNLQRPRMPFNGLLRPSQERQRDAHVIEHIGLRLRIGIGMDDRQGLVLILQRLLVLAERVAGHANLDQRQSFTLAISGGATRHERLLEQPEGRLELAAHEVQPSDLEEHYALQPAIASIPSDLQGASIRHPRGPVVSEELVNESDEIDRVSFE